MLAASAKRIDALLDDRDLVLDVGGWASPMARADWVIDLMPYETRGLYGEREDRPERFGAETWVERDICDRDPWPFSDRQFDFAVCSHTLEDVRDPVWVCSELMRVAHAGYIEVPARAEEQCLGVAGPFAGWSHHRWLVDVGDGRIEFLFKPAILHVEDSLRVPRRVWAALEPAGRVQCMFWEGGFKCAERIHLDREALFADLRAAAERAREKAKAGARGGHGHMGGRAQGSLGSRVTALWRRARR